MEALILFFVLIVVVSLCCMVELKTEEQMGEDECSDTPTTYSPKPCSPRSYGIYLLKSGKDRYNKLRRKRIQKQRDKW